jgi:lysozyme family protein
MNFDQAFDRLISNEGGYVNHPDDPGGETKFGISKRSYPRVDIKNLTRDEAKQIYRTDFWLRGQMDQYDGAVSFQVFDAAVNHGIGNAIRLLQKAAGVADDGHIGPVTIAAVKAKSVTDMLMLFIAWRIRFWTKLSTWDSFGRGWANRAADDLVYAAEDA